MSALDHIRYYLYFRRAIPNFGVGWSRVTHPSATRPCGLVRLACVRHAASVNPEPGSNSPSDQPGRSREGGKEFIWAPSQGACGREIVSTLQLSRCGRDRPGGGPALAQSGLARTVKYTSGPVTGQRRSQNRVARPGGAVASWPAPRQTPQRRQLAGGRLPIRAAVRPSPRGPRWGRQSELLAPREGPRHGAIVGVGEFAPHGQPVSQPGHPGPGALQAALQVAGGGLSLDI